MLRADDPTRTKDTAQFQSESGAKVWRKHAGNFRIFFVVDSTEIEINTHAYKGTVWVTDIRKKETKTYK